MKGQETTAAEPASTTAAPVPVAEVAATEASASMKVSQLKEEYASQKNRLTADLNNFQDFNQTWQAELLSAFRNYLTVALNLYKTDVAPGVEAPAHLGAVAPWFETRFFPSPEAEPSSE